MINTRFLPMGSYACCALYFSGDDFGSGSCALRRGDIMGPVGPHCCILLQSLKCVVSPLHSYHCSLLFSCLNLGSRVEYQIPCPAGLRLETKPELRGQIAWKADFQSSWGRHPEFFPCRRAMAHNTRWSVGAPKEAPLATASKAKVTSKKKLGWTLRTFCPSRYQSRPSFLAGFAMGGWLLWAGQACWHGWSAASTALTFASSLPTSCRQSMTRALLTCGGGAPAYFAPGFAPFSS